jgi:hypothetical protein
MPAYPERLITGMELREYFRSALAAALERQQFWPLDETVVYISHLLASFTHAERLFDRTTDGVALRPLAQLYGDAVSADSGEERDQRLRRLGDVALFIAGLFAHSLSRSLVDVDYYISMGGGAYGRLASSRAGTSLHSALKDVYAELAGSFPRFVDVLGDVGDRVCLGSSADVLRLYEIWLCTGSSRAAARLRELGIEPVPNRRSTH